MEDVGKLCFALWSGGFQQIKNYPQVRGISLRRDLLHDRFCHTRQANRVALLARQIAERRHKPPAVFELRDAARAKIHRAAGIKNEAAAEIGVGLEFLDIEAVGAAIRPPVEPPQVVAGNIFAIFGEFDTGAAVRTGMPARNISLHRPPGQKRQSRQAREHLGVEKAAGLAVREHALCCPFRLSGSLTLSDNYRSSSVSLIKRPMICFASRPSACAANVVITRCVSTGTATSRTSSSRTM